MKNIFSGLDSWPHNGPECFDPLLTSDAGILVERIISHGHTTEGQWYDQDRDEWVLILEGHARLGYADGTEVMLHKGDYLLIPRHVRHRVTFTSSPCLWLAIHARDLVQPSSSEEIA